MKTWKRFVLPGLCALTLLSIASPVFAAPDEIKIPPLREWPIIGTIIRIVERIVKKEPPEPVEPEAVIPPDLPKYTIESKEDIRDLLKLEQNKTVHIMISEEAAMRMINEALPSEFKDMIAPTVTFNKDQAIITADVDPKVLDSVDVEVPISVDDGLFVEVTLSFGAEACQATVNVIYVAVNNFSIGLKKLAQDWLNDNLPGLWPKEICAELIVIEDGKINIVGYRK